MAISRMDMERQLRAGGGIMTLEEPRQGYFLGKIVKKAKRAVKKVTKSPLGKLALLGGLGAFGLGSLGGGTGFLGRFAPSAIKKGFLRMAGPDKMLGNLFFSKGKFDLGKTALTGLAGTAIAAPFLMGGDEEEEVPEESFTGPISSVESIRDQARAYYGDPTNSALYFMPQKQFTRPFASGGLADIPRQGYKMGEIVEKLSMFTPSGIGMAAGKKVAESIKGDEEGENMMMAGMGNVMKLFENYDGSFDRGAFEDMLIQYEDSGAKANGVKLMDFAVDFLGISSMKEGGRVPMQEGGLMDLGGMEKDYREGGFVPLGAEERADDVPARLSKNEFVFTADAVRNAGQGDIDKGAEVMQNMMDNLEAGGTISEESQGMENPAQAMFDQAQMMESRIE
jgi:hypothetical protein